MHTVLSPSFHNYFIHKVEGHIGRVMVENRKGCHLVLEYYQKCGNPLQCSCLENPRDGGAWWAALYGVAQSRT